ncbi:MAG: 4Fe-4S binding protein [Bacteroidia bacterium]|nr:4Fe-4S binding protein [Bacteroidia bacterium]
MAQSDLSLSLANPYPRGYNTWQKLALALVGLGVLGMLTAVAGGAAAHPAPLLVLTLAGLMGGGALFAWQAYMTKPAGIQNNGVFFLSESRRGAWGWVLGVVLTGFYVLLYWFPQYFGLGQGEGGANAGLVRLFDPLSMALRHKPADQWFLYGTFYTVAVLTMGFKFALKYRHNRYQLIRTVSVAFFQLVFAFLIPAWLVMMNEPEFYFSYFWPLKKEYLFPNDLNYYMTHPGTLGVFMTFWAVAIALIGVPVLTYFFGKRWYCSWVCGCGGLAETAGDPFRHLSDKSLNAWKIERWLIHSVLVAIVLLTGVLWINSATQGQVLGGFSQGYAKWYGFLIGSMFSGVIGTGFYPLMGSRVWCRFGCPQAAILGIFQRFFSRFRITTNHGQCISCGNCSTYCEMGIDVRAYAQRGQNIVRASCVGCGICAAVCPRGVLRLENGPDTGKSRMEQSLF